MDAFDLGENPVDPFNRVKANAHQGQCCEIDRADGFHDLDDFGSRNIGEFETGCLELLSD